MENLTISKSSALKAFNNASADTKALLQDLFGKDVFVQQKITDRVKTWEDACNVIGVDPDEIYTGEADADDKARSAFDKLMVIVKALNEGWKPDWTDEDEYKWYPWFDLSEGFAYYDVFYDYTASYVGSRLCFKSRELAEYAAKQFLSLYKDFMTL
jgi:hypothetical protein